MRRVPIPLLVALLPAAAPVQDALPAGPHLVAEAREGPPRTLTPGALALGPDTPLPFLSVRFEGWPEPPERPPVDDTLELRLLGGDRLAGIPAGGAGERLLVELDGGTVVPTGIDLVLSGVFPARLGGGDPAALEAPEVGDRLYRVAPEGLDRVDGTLAGFSAEGISFEGVVGRRVHPWDEVAAFFVEPLGLVEPERLAGPGVLVVELRDGSRIRGRALGFDGEVLELERPDGERVALPAATIAELTVADGRLVHLSAREPDRAVEGSPFGDELGMVWRHRADRAVTGAPLTVDGERVTRGIGVQAPSRLEWDLDGGWAELRGAVAVDDSALRVPGRGSVRFRVLVDGEVAWESDVLRAGDGARALPAIPLADARRLVLVADAATDLHVGDRADWLRVRLVRAEPTAAGDE